MLNPEVPVDFAVIEFPGNEIRGELAPEIYRLVEQGYVRVVDIVMISKDTEGQFTAVELNELPEDLYRQFMPFDEQLAPLFTDEDIETAASYVRNNTAALILLWQNIWTENFRRAVQNANGRIITHERIPTFVMQEVLNEINTASD
jgi:hypothetical protein